MSQTMKKTRPGTAATVRDAQIHSEHLNNTTKPDAAQAPDLIKFMQTSIWEYGTDLERIHTDLKQVNNIFVILSDVPDSDECSAYAQQFDAVVSTAISFVNELREQVNKAAQGIYAHDRLRRALVGGDQQ